LNGDDNIELHNGMVALFRMRIYMSFGRSIASDMYVHVLKKFPNGVFTICLNFPVDHKKL
jgi:hypothetical protein